MEHNGPRRRLLTEQFEVIVSEPSWNNTKVVVTGAGGFIGSHLVERLLTLGADVTAFLRYNSRNDLGDLGCIGDGLHSLRIVRGEVRESVTVRNLLDGADTVFHLAALVGIPYSYVHPNEVIEVNTIGTLNVLNAARDHRVRRVIVTSTSEVYGTARYIPMDEAHPKQPQSPYAASKIAADALALSFYHAFGLPVAVVRPFNTYGPRQSDRAVIPTIISQALAQREVRIGNVTPTRDFTFVTDTVEGMLRVAESDSAVGREINLGTGREISIGDLAREIAALTGAGVTIRQDEGRRRPPGSEVERLVSSNARAKELAGWTPQVALEEGLRLTIEWIRRHSARYDPGVYRI